MSATRPILGTGNYNRRIKKEIATPKDVTRATAKARNRAVVQLSSAQLTGDEVGHLSDAPLRGLLDRLAGALVDDVETHQPALGPCRPQLARLPKKEDTGAQQYSTRGEKRWHRISRGSCQLQGRSTVQNKHRQVRTRGRGRTIGARSHVTRKAGRRDHPTAKERALRHTYVQLTISPLRSNTWADDKTPERASWGAVCFRPR